MSVKLESNTDKWFLVVWLTCVPFVHILLLEEDPIYDYPVKPILYCITQTGGTQKVQLHTNRILRFMQTIKDRLEFPEVSVFFLHLHLELPQCFLVYRLVSS